VWQIKRTREDLNKIRYIKNSKRERDWLYEGGIKIEKKNGNE
jgi:hypothetical protein